MSWIEIGLTVWLVVMCVLWWIQGEDMSSLYHRVYNLEVRVGIEPDPYKLPDHD